MLAHAIHNDLQNLPSGLLPVETADTAVAPLRAQNDDLARAYTAGAIPIPRLTDLLIKKLQSGKTPILVHGPARVGKSTLLALLSIECARRFPDALVIRHFVEAEGVAPDHGLLLHHLLTELVPNELASGTPQPTLEGMQEQFLDTIASLRRRRVIIIIDALDELRNSSQNLKWLPQRLPPGVSLIVSATPSDAQRDALRRKWRQFQIDERPKEIDAETLRHMHDAMDASQISSRIDPLDGDYLDSTTEAMLHPEPGAPIRYMLDRMLNNESTELDNGASKRARTLLQLLCCSRRGLSMEELCGLGNITLGQCVEFLAAARHIVTRHGIFIVFYHSTVRAEVRTVVFTDPDNTTEEHTETDAILKHQHEEMGDYFQKHSLPERRTEEAPWQWNQADAREKLRAYVEDLEMFEEMISNGRGHELLQYWLLLGDMELMAETYRVRVNEWLARDGVTKENAQGVVRRLEQLGQFLSACGKYDASERFLKNAVNLCRRHLRHDQRGLAMLLAMHGEVLRLLGRYDDSIDALHSGLNSVQSLQEPAPVMKAQIANDLGLALGEVNDPEALKFLRQALQLKRNHLGEHHYSTAETLNDIAVVHLGQGQYFAAMKILDLAIPILCPPGLQRTQDYESPMLATCMHNYASALDGCGEKGPAMDILLRVLEMRERILGNNHHFTIITRINVVVWLYRDGDTESARAWAAQAWKDIAAVLNNEHPHYLAATISLAQVLQVFGEINQAQTMLFQTLGTCRRVLPPQHRITASCLHNFARLLDIMHAGTETPCLSKELLEAERFAKEAVAAWRAAIVPNCVSIAKTLILLGDIRERIGRKREALSNYCEACELYEACIGPDDERTREAKRRRVRLGDELGPEDDMTSPS
ncbi:MAG: hypothetical protein JWQ98_356 [Chlorobi bacterium]|nr:hypothetical protein [Chlorobiota bacterium]